MTVSSLIPVNTYTGNNSSTKFDFDFLIESENELKVTYVDKYKTQTELKNGVDYKINKIGDKNGSYITFPLETSKYRVLGDDETIILELTLQIKQESKFENSGNISWDEVEWSFDYIVRILQIMSRKIAKAIKIPEGNNQSGDEILKSLEESQANSQKYAEFAEEKAEDAQNSANEVSIQIQEIKTLTDQVKFALGIIKPAQEDSLGMIKPDNKTTKVDENGTLSVIGLNNPYTLFDYKYSDYQLYNASWLLSDGNYVNNSLYPTAYDALVIEQDSTKDVGQTYELPGGGSYIKRGLSVKLSNEEYTDYDFVINTDNKTLRLPLLLKITQVDMASAKLYFYIGESIQNLSMIDVGNILENCVFKTQLTECQTVIDTYTNGSSWYRIWSDGWCEQGGYINSNNATTNFTVSFLKTYKDNNYYFSQTQYSTGDDYYLRVTNKTPSNITVQGQNDCVGFNWIAFGYLEEGEY